MVNNFLISLIISIIYIIFKFLDMRYIKKDIKPLKDLILDSCVVFISSIITFLLFEQFNLSEILNNAKPTTEVFTGTAEF